MSVGTRETNELNAQATQKILMSDNKAFLLIPGARLPVDEADRIVDSLSPESRQALEAIGEGAGQAVPQVFDHGCYRRAPHLVWLWKVITRRETLPHEAPWRWLALGGREQAPELWCLTPYTLKDGRITQTRPPLDDSTFMQLTFAIEPVFLKAGLRLQIWDCHWFLTRREDWALTATPAMALSGLTPDEALLEGDAALDVRQMLKEVETILTAHPINAERRAKGEPTIDGVWISGGGHEELFFPPTLIRSVAADDDAVRGWANAAGILIERLGRDQGHWPDAPHGNIIAVIEDLYAPWLAKDWDAWGKALPQVAQKLKQYREDAERFEANIILTVAFGETGAVTLAPAESGLMDRLFRRKSQLAPAAWCPDRYQEGAH